MAEMDYKTALDLANSYHTKMVKPFEKLAEVLAVAVKAEAGAKEADAQRAKALRELEEFQKGLALEQAAGARGVADARKAQEATANLIREESGRRRAEHDKAMRELDLELEAHQKAHAAAIDALNSARTIVEEECSKATAKARTDLSNAERAYNVFLKKTGVIPD